MISNQNDDVAPNILRGNRDTLFTWSQYSPTPEIELTKPRQNHTGLVSEFTARLGKTELVTKLRLELSNPQSRKAIVDYLIRADNSGFFVPWNRFIDFCAGYVLDNFKLRELHLVTVADVIAIEVDWLWQPYIPLGKLTLLEGDPGIGKSWIALAIATSISLGGGLSGIAPCEPSTVVLASAEDGIADTIRPRLDEMAADITRIQAVDELFTLDQEGCDALGEQVERYKPRLVIIDPLVAYLAGNLDTSRANQVREVTARLAKIAESNNCSILALRHLTKARSGKPIMAGQGSIDFTASARSVLLAGEDGESGTRAIVHIKSNLAQKGDSIGYEIRDGCFYWTGASTVTAEQILTSDESKGAKEDAIDFLTEILLDGPALSEDIQKQADIRGISSRTLNRAKRELSIESYREGNPGKKGGGSWYWKLKNED